MNKHFITEIKINELRHLINVNIELSKKECKHLILTGKNGVGKTTILEAVRNYLKCLEINFTDTICIWNKELKKNKLELQNEVDENRIVLLQNNINKIEKQLNDYGTYGIEIEVYPSNPEINAFFRQGKFIFAYFTADRQTSVQIPKSPEKISLKEAYSINDKPSEIFIKYLLDLKTQQSFARNEGDLEVVKNIEA